MKIAMEGIPNNVFVEYHLVDLEEPTHASVKELVSLNLSGKLSGFLQKVSSRHPDGGINISVTLKKNKSKKFDGVFLLDYPGIESDFRSLDNGILRYERVDFVNLDDLINHAFQNFKERFANNTL